MKDLHPQLLKAMDIITLCMGCAVFTDNMSKRNAQAWRRYHRMSGGGE